MKKISILGSILILLFPLFLFGGVSASVDKRAIYPGDSVTLTITASGKNIEFPKIDKIDNYDVRDSGVSTNIVIINGNMTTTKKKLYSFNPDKNVTIPSFSVKVDGKEYKTAPIAIKILDSKSAKALRDASLELRANKNISYVAEPINLELILKVKANANIAQAQIEQPKFENLWVKQVGDVQKYQEGEYIIQMYRFLAFPQQSGIIEIGPIIADIAKIKKDAYDPFFGSGMSISLFGEDLKWSKIRSNKLVLKVKELPNNLELFGKFNIKAEVDKKRVKAGEAVNLTITVDGVGNIDDVKKFNIDIPNAVVYSDEPKVISGIKDGQYGGSFTQKVAIVADSNYTIPSLTLRYFDKDSKKEVVKKTKPISIEVIGGSKSSAVIQKPKIEVASDNNYSKNAQVVVKKESSYIKYLMLIIGFILGAASILMWQKVKNKKVKKELSIVKKIKKAKDKELYKILLPYAKESQIVANELKKLEDNIYNGAKNKINKEAIIEYFEELEEQ